jgi:BON domain-containing protein
VLVLIALAGSNRPSAAATQSGTAKQSKDATSKNPADAQIERTIKNKLAKSKMNSDHFTVSVVKGVATLEGSTNVMQRKGAMTRMAKSSGATSVRNNIRVSDAAKNKAIASLAKGRSAPSGAPAETKTAPAKGPPAASGKLADDPASVPRATVLPTTK